MKIFKRIKQLEVDNKTLKERLDTIVVPWDKTGFSRQSLVGKEDLVECEKCGCLLNRSTAIKGVGEIRKREVAYFIRTRWEDFIYYPYYCKIHKPKEGKTVK